MQKHLGAAARGLLGKFVDAFRKAPVAEPRNPKTPRLLARFYREEALAKNPGTKALREAGFETYVNVRGRVYVVRHGTRYRLDRLKLPAVA